MMPKPPLMLIVPCHCWRLLAHPYSVYHVSRPNFTTPSPTAYTRRARRRLSVVHVSAPAFLKQGPIHPISILPPAVVFLEFSAGGQPPVFRNQGASTQWPCDYCVHTSSAASSKGILRVPFQRPRVLMSVDGWVLNHAPPPGSYTRRQIASCKSAQARPLVDRSTVTDMGPLSLTWPF